MVAKTTQKKPVSKNKPVEATKVDTSVMKFNTGPNLGGPSVAVVGRIRRKGTRDIVVSIPTEFNSQLMKCVAGAKSVAIAALAQWAISELDRRGECLYVTEGDAEQS